MVESNIMDIYAEKWKREQLELKKQLIITDDNNYKGKGDVLKYIGGVDISFIKGDDINACSSYVILSYPDLKVVYEKYVMVKLNLPYIAGFLAFREVEHVEKLINDCKKDKPEITPQIIFVDGNGVLHPNGFGFASLLKIWLSCN